MRSITKYFISIDLLKCQRVDMVTRSLSRVAGAAIL